MSRIRILFCWSTISGYMSACWAELASAKDVDLHVIAHRPRGASAFAENLMENVPATLLAPESVGDVEFIRRKVSEFKPDIVIVTGWWLKAYRDVVVGLPKSTRVVLAIDTPWRNPLQVINRVRYRKYLRRIDHVLVTGERSWVHARHLGFADSMISRGMYGIDASGLGEVYKQRCQNAWPQQFVFAGRYVSIKGIDVLLTAYRQYRRSTKVGEPWPLVCCGMGPMQPSVEAEEGVVNRGFVQPLEMRQVLRESGAFVLPSTYDPWPLAIVEASAAGLPVICTSACGSAVEVVRPHYNGIVVPTGDVDALSEAFEVIASSYDELREWGKRATELAAPYAAEVWVKRVRGLSGKLTD